MLGTFLALDFFLFYIFWEVMLLPMYFLIGVWGGPRREYAAIKFFLYTLFGSVFILIAMLGFYFTDVRDFVPKDGRRAGERRTATNARPCEQGGEGIEYPRQHVRSAGAAAGRAVAYDGRRQLDRRPERQTASDEHQRRLARQDRTRRLRRRDERSPSGSIRSRSSRSRRSRSRCSCSCSSASRSRCRSFPFHTWLPDAHVEAPTPICMILAGILLKLGGYGIIRIAYPICPWAAEYLASVSRASSAMINIVYGAFAAMAQTDFKKLVAYSSVSHMGYVHPRHRGLVGGRARSTGRWGMNGAMFQMIAHGISSAGMFFCVGVIYDRAHHRNLDNFRGLFEPMPLYGGISCDHLLRRPGPARPVRVRRRVHGHPRHLELRTPAVSERRQGLRVPGGPHRRHHRGVHPVDACSASTWGRTRSTRITPTSRSASYCAAIPLVIFAVLLGVYPELHPLLDGAARDRAHRHLHRGGEMKRRRCSIAPRLCGAQGWSERDIEPEKVRSSRADDPLTRPAPPAKPGRAGQSSAGSDRRIGDGMTDYVLRQLIRRRSRAICSGFAPELVLCGAIVLRAAPPHRPRQSLAASASSASC